MAQTIADLQNGNIAPCEHCGSHDPELNRLSRLVERNRETLCEELTAAQKETFQTYIDCADAYQLRSSELAFREGFRVGSKLAIEVLT